MFVTFLTGSHFVSADNSLNTVSVCNEERTEVSLEFCNKTALYSLKAQQGHILTMHILCKSVWSYLSCIMGD